VAVVALIPPGISPVAPSTAGLKFVTETLRSPAVFIAVLFASKKVVLAGRAETTFSVTPSVVELTLTTKSS
jgi:hypothetical protein